MIENINDEILKQLSLAIEEQNQNYIKEVLTDMHPTDVSEILQHLENQESKYILSLFPVEIGAEIISHLDSEIRFDFFKLYTHQEIAKIIENTETDDAADILRDFEYPEQEAILYFIEDKEQLAQIRELLHYEEDSAGGLVAKELIKTNIHWTVQQCIEEIRRQAENVEKIIAIYVVDDNNVLLGRLSPKKILLAQPNVIIGEIYEPEVHSVSVNEDRSEVANMMRQYDLESIAVVDEQGRLIGRITIDDVVDVITEQAETEQRLMSGLSENVEEDDSVWAITRARLPWLIVGMAGGLMGAQFMGFFEKDLEMLPAMAFFIPLITATGGNVGIQSSTIVVQALANNSFSGSTIQRLLKALLVAIVNGFAIAVLVLIFNIFFLSVLKLSLVVSTALFSVILLASFTGTLTPIVLDKFGVNPAVASGPFITTANDLLGLAVYFGVARLLY